VKFLARHDSLIANVGTAILTAGYYWGVIRPGQNAATIVQKDISQAQEKMHQVPVLMAEQAQLQARLQRQQEQIEQMKHVVPTDSRLSDVLHQVASLASQSGVTITRLEPLQAVEFASYASHPFHLGCRGAFDDVARFVKGLESQPRLVAFGKVDLIRSTAGIEGSERPIQANIDFSVFSRHSKN